MDSSGQLIRRMDLGQQPAGLLEFQWNGMTDGQKRASEGNYTIAARVIRGLNVEGIETLIKAGIENAEVTVVDLTGTKDHFRVEVISETFSDQSLINQHRSVQKTVQAAIDDGRIHAFSVITSTKS